MERADGWNLAMRAAGIACVGASSFPVFVLLIGVVTRSVAQTLQAALMGGILLAVAAVAVVVCMAVLASERTGQASAGWGWIGAG